MFHILCPSVVLDVLDAHHRAGPPRANTYVLHMFREGPRANTYVFFTYVVTNCVILVLQFDICLHMLL